MLQIIYFEYKNIWSNIFFLLRPYLAVCRKLLIFITSPHPHHVFPSDPGIIL